jgi:hypothetical protein
MDGWKFWIPRGVGRATVLALFVMLAASGFASPARADDGAVGGLGGDVYPIPNADIRMAKETVQATLFGRFAEFRADFQFVNDGPIQTVRLGFPFAVTAADLPGRGIPLSCFRAWQDGRPLEITMGREVSQRQGYEQGEVGYYLHTATFPPGVSTVTVSYLALPSGSAGSRFPDRTPPQFQGMSNYYASYDYWLHTGAGWKGTIGKAVIRFSLADSFLGWGVDLTASDVGEGHYGLTGPVGYTRPDPRSFQWVFEDFEPATEAKPLSESPYDIHLFFSQPQSGLGVRGVSDLGPFVIDATAQPTVAGFSPESAADGNPATAWATTPNDEGPASITFTLSGSHPVQEIRIVPGNNGTLTSFYESDRPKTVLVSFSDGTVEILDLRDEPGLQRFVVGAEKAEWAKLAILDTYPGTQDHTIYLSEVEFGSAPAPAFRSFSRLILQREPLPANASTAVAATTPATPSTSVGGTEPVTPASAEPTVLTATTEADQAAGGLVSHGTSAVQILIVALGGAAVLVGLAGVVIGRRRGRVRT